MIKGLYPLYLFNLCLSATHLVGVMFIIKDLFRWTDSFSKLLLEAFNKFVLQFTS